MNNYRRHSRKREAILEFMRSTKAHPSAEDIYSGMKLEYPDLSLGTVYRNLGLFLSSGEIISVGTVNGQERFDACTRPHLHFVCTKCGKIEDVSLEDASDGFYPEVEQNTGGKIISHSLTFFGICKKCRCFSASDSVPN